ncbi:tetratricopeptide repeat protein [Amycolatopsis sp. NPDC005003]
MVWERVVAIGGPGGPGSGYEVAPRLVLTAAHLVAEAGASVSVFHPGRPGLFTGTVVWCGSPGGRDDAALVSVGDPGWQPVEGSGVVWGRPVTHRAGLVCEAWGVPDLVQRPGRPIDVLQVPGKLNPGDRLVGERYVLQLTSFPPEGESPWGGMSGAALLCGDLVVGVVSTDPAGRAHAALEAVPVSLLLRDPGFSSVLAPHTGDAGPSCEAVELWPLADAPSRAAPGGSVSSPAGLLPARRAVVPFHGREGVLADGAEWARSPGVGLWLLHGPGGQGKTRLAHQFGRRLASDGWAVLWLDARASSLEVLAEVRVPTLLVLDYAESRTGQLAALVEVLSRRAGGVPVKVLLLARTAGAWWTDTVPAGGDLSQDLAEAARVVALTVLDDGAGDRQRSYRSAVTAFAAALGRVPGQAPASWLEAAAALVARAEPDTSGNTVLAVQMTALADLLDTAAAHEDDPRRPGPEDRLLTHERRYWAATAQAHELGLSPATLEDVVAATALLGPSTTDELAAVLARAPAVADLPRDRRNAVRDWLLHLYPGEDHGFAGLAPDRLAERLIGRLLVNTARSGIIEHLAAHADEAEAERLLTVATRAAAHPALGPHAGDALAALCDRHHGLLVPALRAAPRIEQPRPLLRAIDRAITDPVTDIAVLDRLSEEVPKETQVLADIAVAIAHARVGKLRQSPFGDPQQDAAALAAALNNLANRLVDLGRREEALAAVREAADIRRSLAEQDPGRHLSDLAITLNNLSLGLGDLGRRHEALTAIREAVDIRRRLTERQPDANLPTLAGSLNNLSNALCGLGRHDEALAHLREAVDLRRRLAGQRPDLHLSDFALSLTNLSILLGDLGRIDEALAAVREAVDIRRRLVEQHPDAHLPGLARSLNAFSVRLGDVGRNDEAVAAGREAVEVYRRLVERHPDAHLPELAGSLNNLSNRLGRLGRRDEALAAIGEAVEAYRRLAEQYPGAHLPNLAAALNNLSNRLRETGRLEEAVAAMREAVDIAQQLAEHHPAVHRDGFKSYRDALDRLLTEA